MNDNAFLSEIEKQRLEDNYNYRKKIVEDAFTNDKIPRDPKDIEAINGVLNSMDKIINDMANNRLKLKENQDKSSVVLAVAEALKKISSSKEKNINPTRVIEISEEYIPLDIVNGETTIGTTQINLSDVLEEKE